MKKILSLNLTKFIYTLFIIGTIVSVFIVYKDVQSNIAIKFVIAYVIFTFFCLLYFSLITLIKLRKLKWSQIKKRLIIFIKIFIFFSALNFIFDYFFRHSKIDLFRELSIPLGLAFGTAFFDVIFKRKQK